MLLQVVARGHVVVHHEHVHIVVVGQHGDVDIRKVLCRDRGSLGGGGGGGGGWRIGGRRKDVRREGVGDVDHVVLLFGRQIDHAVHPVVLAVLVGTVSTAHGGLGWFDMRSGGSSSSGGGGGGDFGIVGVGVGRAAIAARKAIFTFQAAVDAARA